jgi:hypothetical protein
MKKMFLSAAACFSLFAFVFSSCASAPKGNSSSLAAISSSPEIQNGEQTQAAADSGAPENSGAAGDNVSQAQTAEEEEVPSERISTDEALIVEPDNTDAPQKETDISQETAAPAEPVVRDEPIIVKQEDTVVPSAAVPQNAEDSKKTVAQSMSPATVQKPAKPVTAVPAAKPVAQAAAKPVAQAAAKPSSQNTEKELQPEKPQSAAPVVIVPSRSVTVQKGQYLDVVYPGTGWVYLGETEKMPLFGYFGRKLDTANTTFSLRSRTNGRTQLHFYKNDALTGEYIDDYLDAIVTDTTAPTGTRTTAPSYADAVPPQPVRKGVTDIQPDTPEIKNNSTQESSSSTGKNTPSNTAASEYSQTFSGQMQTPAAKTSSPEKEANVKTIIQTSESAPSSWSPPASKASPSSKTSSSVTPMPSESSLQTSSLSASSAQTSASNSSPAFSSSSSSQSDSSTVDLSLLDQAQKLYDAGSFEEALSQVQNYLTTATARIDEALYLQGLILESESKARNIRNAIDSYDTLVKQYPSSALWQKAKNRSVYLKRFYIDIR